MRRGWRLACHPYRTMCSTSICLDGATRSALLMQARNGDLESLAKLILPYAPGLYLGALRMTRNPADAEDVRQDASWPSKTHPGARLPRPQDCVSSAALPGTTLVRTAGSTWPTIQGRPFALA